MPILVHLPSSTGSTQVAYAVCSTPSTNPNKTVTIPDFELAIGRIITVLFNNIVNNNATLNVNGTGNKYIQWCGVNLSDDAIKSGGTCELVYTGNCWNLISDDGIAAYGGIPSFAEASWEDVNKACQNGTYKTAYKIGDAKDITLSTGEVITMRIEDFDHDNLTGGGKSKISLLMKNCLSTERRMNSTSTTVGGMNASEMQGWLSNDFYNQLPSDLKPLLKSVDKITSAGNASSNLVTNSVKIWLPTFTELNFLPDAGYSPGGEGTPYPLFTDNASRIKTVNGSASNWWSSSPYATDTYGFVGVFRDGFLDAYSASNSHWVAAGFNL